MHSSTMLGTRIFTIHTNTSTKDSVLSHVLTWVSNLHLSGFKIVGWQIGCEFLNTWWTICLILEYSIVLFFHFFVFGCWNGCDFGAYYVFALEVFGSARILSSNHATDPIPNWPVIWLCSIVVLYLDIHQNLRWFQDICNFTFSNLQKVLQSMPHFPTSKILRINHQLATKKSTKTKKLVTKPNSIIDWPPPPGSDDFCLALPSVYCSASRTRCAPLIEAAKGWMGWHRVATVYLELFT